MNRHDAYLSALNRLLFPHMTPEARHRRVEEIRSHLELDQADREARGMDSETAARSALRAVGSPSVLARQMIRQARGYDSASSFRLALPFGVALVLALGVPMWLITRGEGLMWADPAIRWLPFIVLIWFGSAVIRTQRWLAPPMIPWVVLAVVAMCGAGMIPQTTAPKPTAQSFRAAFSSLDHEQRLVSEWKAGHPPQNEAPMSEAQVVESTYVPFSPFDLQSSQESVAIKAVDARTASEAWRRNGTAYASDLDQRVANIRETVAELEHPPKPVPIQWGGVLSVIAIGTVEIALPLFVVNWLLLCVSTAVAMRRNRRDPLLT